MRTITKKEWNKKKKVGYTSVTNGQKKILVYNLKHGTVLEPVNVED